MTSEEGTRDLNSNFSFAIKGIQCCWSKMKIFVKAWATYLKQLDIIPEG